MKNLLVSSVCLSQLILFCSASSASLADDVGTAHGSGRYESSYRGEFPESRSGSSGGGGEEHDESNVMTARKANFEPAFTPPRDAPQSTQIEITSRTNTGAANDGSYNNAASNVQSYDNNNGEQSQEARVAFPAGFPYGDAGGSDGGGGHKQSGGYGGQNLQRVQHYVPGKGYTGVHVAPHDDKQSESYGNNDKQQQDSYYPSAPYAAAHQPSSDSRETSIQITTSKAHQQQPNYDEGYSAPSQQGKSEDGEYKPGKDDKPDPNAVIYVPGKGYTKGLDYYKTYGPWSPGYGLQPNPNDKDDGKAPPNSEHDPFYNQAPSHINQAPAHQAEQHEHVDNSGQYKQEDNGQYKPEQQRHKKQQFTIHIKPAASYVGGYGGGGGEQQQSLKSKANYEPAFSPPAGASQYADYSGQHSGGGGGGHSPAAYGGSRNDYARRNNDEDGATASYSPFYNDQYDVDKQLAAYGSKPSKKYPPPKYGPGSDDTNKEGDGDTPVINNDSQKSHLRRHRHGQRGRPVYGYMGNSYAPGISAGAYFGGPTSFGMPSSGGMLGGGPAGGYGMGSAYSVDRPSLLFRPNAPTDLIVASPQLTGRRAALAARQNAAETAAAEQLLLAALTNPDILGL